MLVIVRAFILAHRKDFAERSTNPPHNNCNKNTTFNCARIFGIVFGVVGEYFAKIVKIVISYLLSPGHFFFYILLVLRFAFIVIHVRLWVFVSFTLYKNVQIGKDEQALTACKTKTFLLNRTE